MKLPAMVKFILVALWGVWASGAGAVTISFDNPATGANNPVITRYSADGFTFTSGYMHHISTPHSCGGGCVDNGTQYLSSGSFFSIEMIADGGLPFSLAGFDGAELKLLLLDSDAVFIDVIGTLQGGGTVMSSHFLDAFRDGAGGANDFESFVVPSDFTSLASVIFAGKQEGGEAGHFSIDNVVAELTATRSLSPEPSRTVPEPGTLLLLGSALTVLCIRRRAS